MTEPTIPITAGLSALKGLRGQILIELKKDQPLTAQELADRHGVTANAIRRHLKELEAEDLIEYAREQRGQGAPTYAYKLTDHGESLFPKRYDKTLTAVLDFLEQSAGRAEVRRFFDQRFRRQAEEILAGLGEVDLETRVAAVVEYLSREGFMAEWSKDSGEIKIAEHNCAMHVVAERFPEVCDSELQFLQDLLGPGVERQQHIVSGCNSCEYAFNLLDAIGPRPAASPEQA